MKRHIAILIFLLSLALAAPSYAFNFSLFNINVGTPEGQRLAGAYGAPYGYSPQQVAPAMLGPAEEVPSILKIAQAAGTVPMTVWMMRKMGFSYTSILSTFALGPSALMGSPFGGSPFGGSPYGYPSSSWGRFTDPFMIQTYRVSFLRNIFHVQPNMIPYLPIGGLPFARSLLYPYHPVYGTWMPPGIAKKYGLWIPPGQRKKIGWWGDVGNSHHGWGGDWKHGKDKWDVKEGHHEYKGKSKWGDDKYNYKGKSKWSEDGNKGEVKFKGKGSNGGYEKKSKGKSTNLAKGNSKEKGGGSSHGKGKGGGKGKK